ncbi:MAG: hypothetical protein ACPGGL_10175 [Phycisphaerales bacterium]
MDEPVQTTPVDDEPLCVCGYSKVGLPEIDHPCPECGSTKLAVYQSSYSYYGWNVALLGAGISVVQILTIFFHDILTTYNTYKYSDLYYKYSDLLEKFLELSWLYVCVPLGGLSLLYTGISLVKREPKRKSVRNICMALISGLGLPIGLIIFWIIYVAGSGA